MKIKRLLSVLIFAALLLSAKDAECAVCPMPGTWLSDYCYQLRDVSGPKDGHTISGAQWFTTVFENWLANKVTSDDLCSYRITHGGQAPAVPMVTSADLVYDFSPVYMEDPRHMISPYSDAYFDPIESVFLVIPEGKGDLNISFGNDYGSNNLKVYMPPDVKSKDVMQDILVSVPGYTVTPAITAPKLIEWGKWLDRSLNFKADEVRKYGSILGYLTFRQSAEFGTPDQGYRESIKIPLVVANVFDGPASVPGNELYFDMTLIDTTGSDDIYPDIEGAPKIYGRVVSRLSFRWGVNENLTHDLGTLFMIKDKDKPMPVYTLVTQITNRTGTRYRVQRYDTLDTSVSNDFGGKGPRDLIPLYWRYDQVNDLYKSLPDFFYLDSQSQAAPGLVSVYKNDVDTTYSSSESFRLYPFLSPEKPQDMRITYRKIGGMTSYGSIAAPRVGSKNLSPWQVTAFNMIFADVAEGVDNTVSEITKIAGASPVMPESFSINGIENTYINADAVSSFQIKAKVPDGLTPVSVDVSADINPKNSALLPVLVRLCVPRQEKLLVGHWDELEKENYKLDVFAKYGTIKVRSPHTSEKDMNLFTALKNRGFEPKDCVRAFAHDDALYLEFIALLIDTKSPLASKTAFCDVVKDDKVPYILLGDGKQDNLWDLSFYVAEADAPKQEEPVNNSSNGGGCAVGGLGIFAAAGIFYSIVRLKKHY